MKRNIGVGSVDIWVLAITLFTILVGILVLSSLAEAAGTVTQELRKVGYRYHLVFNCEGDSSDGSIPDTTVLQNHYNKIKGRVIYRVLVNNTTSQTDVTADSDVYIRDVSADSTDTDGGNDLLDGQGVDSLDSDTKNRVTPSTYETIDELILLDVDNQSETSAQYTIIVVIW
jgi:hypothetical protein